VPDSVSPALARRIAIAAQGFGSRPSGPIGTRQLNTLVHRLGLLQIDSVNVFERSHYLPVFARLGQYDKALLDRLTFGPRARYVETWAHEASIIPVETWPLWRWKMAALREKDHADASGWAASNPAMLDWLRAELAAKGPLAASAIDHDLNVGTGSWWGWSDVKLGLEYLFRWGEVVPAGRNRFERVYALAEQVLPREILDTQIDSATARRQLLALAARAHGIGTANDLADYYRLPFTSSKPLLADLVDDGELVVVDVPGWGRPAYLHREARMPRRIEAAALLSPFDPIVWARERALRLFGFHYRIEIYTPAEKRVYGYYTLPLLVDDRIVGRIDLKNDRQNRVLRVQSAWREPHAPTGIEQRVVPVLEEIRRWQGLERIEVVDCGDLSADLRAALGPAASD
jgi:hypothetical protein